MHKAPGNQGWRLNRLLLSMALINIPLMWDSDVPLSFRKMGHGTCSPSSPFFAFAGLDDVPVSLSDCPQSLLHLAGWNLCHCPTEHEGGPGLENHVLELNLKCLLYTYICVYIYALWRGSGYSQSILCNGFKYNSLAPAAFRGACWASTQQASCPTL